MNPTNKFLKEEDYKLVSYASMRKEFEDIYIKELRKTPSTYGSKRENQTKIHWSRDWEYPWAVIESGVKSGHRVLDCGCGGSPLLPFLARYGCEAYGVDPGINAPRPVLRSHYGQVLNRVMSKLKRQHGKNARRAGASDAVASGTRACLFHRAVRLLRRPSDAWEHDAKRMKKLGLDIRYFPDSLDRMHFEDEFFDRVFCISVIEHLREQTAYTGMKEMARVLKKDGLLVVTVDHDGSHVNPRLTGRYRELIAATGLSLQGESDFALPDISQVPGTYNVAGFVLKK